MSKTARDTPLRLSYLSSAEAVVAAAGSDCGPVELVGVLPTDPFEPPRQGTVDVLLIRFEIAEPDLVTSPPEYTEERILLAGLGHPLAAHASVSYDEVADHSVFARPPDMPEHTWNQIVPDRTPTGREVPVTNTASDMLEMLNAIIAGTAGHPSVSPMATWAQVSRHRVRPLADLPAVPVSLTWRAEPDAGNGARDGRPAVGAFVDAVLAGSPESGRAKS